MPATTFSDGPAIEKIASRLIANDPGLLHLSGIPIRYLFSSKASTVNGKAQLGKASLYSGAKAFLGVRDDDEREELREAQGAEAFFVIECAANFWEKLKDRQREALVHELLCRLYWEDVENKESGTIRRLMILDYDFKGFGANIAKYGGWREDAQLMIDAATVHVQPGFDFSTHQPMAATARREKRESKVREKAERKAKGPEKDESGDTPKSFNLVGGGIDYVCQTENDGQGALIFKFFKAGSPDEEYRKAVAASTVPHDMAPLREFAVAMLEKMMGVSEPEPASRNGHAGNGALSVVEGGNEKPGSDKEKATA